MQSKKRTKQLPKDPSENACIEIMRPKTVPEGIIALGTVLEISEIQVKLQLTGGVICLVDRFSVSQHFTKSLEESSKRYSPDNLPPRLGQIFKKGQQYVCKVLEKKPRKGYADALDIIATLDPTSIQDEVLPRTLLSIPQVPLQVAVQSVEDHGYQMDLGFKGITGFLSFEEAKSYCSKHNGGTKFIVGQVVRCCLKESIPSEHDLRVVHLALNKDIMKKSKFTQEKVSNVTLTANCILPGSKSFLTVMKVSRDGLVVNFMNEFGGFIDVNHLKDDWHDPKENYKISDQFECTVLYYNQMTKIFALSIRNNKTYKLTLKHFLENYHVGKVIKKAQVIRTIGVSTVVFKVNKKYKAVASARDALDMDTSTMTKDDLYTHLDSTFPDGSEFLCRVKSINLTDLILVVSLRQEFLELPYMSVEELKPADLIEATVKKYVKDGIVVTFGLNLRAIILNKDLHDYVSPKSYKRYPPGKTVKCRVLKVDVSKQPARVYLTNKEQLMDPKLTIISLFDESMVGKQTQATIFKISPKGIIVELFNNVKGFIPKIFLSLTPISDINSLFKIGQVLPCVVSKVIPSKNSLQLGLIPYENIVQMKKRKKAEKRKRREQKQTLGKRKRTVQEEVEEVEGQKDDDDDDDDEEENEDDDDDDERNSFKTNGKFLLERKLQQVPEIKSRRQRSEEAKAREERLRDAENRLLDPNRQPESISDFERLLLKTPNNADLWIRYSKFFLDNIETEKARIVCRRALKTISFRLEKEKLKIWLQMIKIEAKYGGQERMKAILEEAGQTSDQLKLYQGAVGVLSHCGELDEAERLLNLMLKLSGKSVDVWSDYISFCARDLSNLEKARDLFEEACKTLVKTDLVTLKSRFAQFEFKYGDVERAKTIFENLLCDNPKRTDLWRVYEAQIKKYGLRQLDNEEARQQNELILQRIAESIELVSKKTRKKLKITKL